MIYRFFVTKARQELVDELMRSIPNNVRNPALRVLVDNKQKVERMCSFMAHELHRKMVQDRKHSEIYEGQLLQIKLFLTMMQTADAIERQTMEPKKDTKLEKAKKGLDEFKQLINRRTS